MLIWVHQPLTAQRVTLTKYQYQITKIVRCRLKYRVTKLHTQTTYAVCFNMTLIVSIHQWKYANIALVLMNLAYLDCGLILISNLNNLCCAWINCLCKSSTPQCSHSMGYVDVPIITKVPTEVSGGWDEYIYYSLNNYLNENSGQRPKGKKHNMDMGLL